MAKYKLTQPAVADLEKIIAYTVRTWSAKQAERYLDDLEACFQELADAPGLGRSCESIRPGLRRMEHGRHVVFYRGKEYGIRIIRILHQRMMPDAYLLGEKE